MVSVYKDLGRDYCGLLKVLSQHLSEETEYNSRTISIPLR